MKVKELIELLEKYDEEMEVYISDSENPSEPLIADGLSGWDGFLLFSQRM